MVSVRQMRSSYLIALLLLLLLPLLFISSAGAKSPRRSPQMAANVLLPDGSFEQNPSLWAERDNTRCTPWIGDWSAIDGYPDAFDGSRYF